MDRAAGKLRFEHSDKGILQQVVAQVDFDFHRQMGSYRVCCRAHQTRRCTSNRIRSRVGLLHTVFVKCVQPVEVPKDLSRVHLVLRHHRPKEHELFPSYAIFQRQDLPGWTIFATRLRVRLPVPHSESAERVRIRFHPYIEAAHVGTEDAGIGKGLAFLERKRDSMPPTTLPVRQLLQPDVELHLGSSTVMEGVSVVCGRDENPVGSRILPQQLTTKLLQGTDSVSLSRPVDLLYQSRDVHCVSSKAVSYTHLRAHETGRNLVCRLLLEK